MNYTLEEAVEALRRWYGEDVIGNLMFFRAPRSENIGCVVDQVIKINEMDTEVADNLRKICANFEGSNGEFRVNSDGQPDRVKVRREF